MSTEVHAARSMQAPPLEAWSATIAPGGPQAERTKGEGRKGEDPKGSEMPSSAVRMEMEAQRRRQEARRGAAAERLVQERQEVIETSLGIPHGSHYLITLLDPTPGSNYSWDPSWIPLQSKHYSWDSS
jgi:hypothetical protein